MKLFALVAVVLAGALLVGCLGGENKPSPTPYIEATTLTPVPSPTINANALNSEAESLVKEAESAADEIDDTELGDLNVSDEDVV